MHDDPTRMTGPKGDQLGEAADDWYRASRDDQAHDSFPADQLNDAYGTPVGYPSVGHSGQWTHGASPATPSQYASQPQTEQKRRGWVAPVALGAVALISFGAVTAVMSKDSSPKQAAPPVVSNSVSQSASSPGTTASTSPTGPSSNTVTVTTTPQPTASQNAPSGVVTPSATATQKTVVAFPSGTNTDCRNDDNSWGHVTDPDVVQTTGNGCNFLPAVKEKVWEHESSSDDSTFDLKVYSSYRFYNRKDLPTEVPITCHRLSGLTNCVNNAQTGPFPINIWVRNKA